MKAVSLPSHRRVLVLLSVFSLPRACELLVSLHPVRRWTATASSCARTLVFLSHHIARHIHHHRHYYNCCCYCNIPFRPPRPPRSSSSSYKNHPHSFVSPFLLLLLLLLLVVSRPCSSHSHTASISPSSSPSDCCTNHHLLLHTRPPRPRQSCSSSQTNKSVCHSNSFFASQDSFLSFSSYPCSPHHPLS